MVSPVILVSPVVETGVEIVPAAGTETFLQIYLLITPSASVELAPLRLTVPVLVEIVRFGPG